MIVEAEAGLKLKKLKILLKAAVVLGIVLIFVGVRVIYSGNEKMDEQKILFNTFRFEGSSSLVSGKSYYLASGQGGPQFYLGPGDTVEVKAIHPPSDFNGSLSNVYFAVWESTPQPGQTPDQLMQASSLPATHIAQHNYVLFQLLSDEPLENLAPGSSWAADFIYPYKIPRNVGLTVIGTVALVSGISTVALASYRLVKTNQSRRPRRT